MTTRPRTPAGSGAVARQSALSGAAATIAVATGLLLDVVTAAVFGAGADTDAFVAAARFPFALTAILMVLGNQILVPTFATWMTRADESRERRLSSTVLLSGVVGGAAVALVLFLAAEPLVWAMAPGFSRTQRLLAADLLQVMALTVPLTAASEVLRAWLNARHMFVIPAAMTAILNLTAAGIIVAVRGDVTIVPVAYVVGASVQMVAMAAVAVWRGLRLARPAFGDTESTHLAGLLVRPSAAASLNPVARIVETVVASFLPAGAVTVLHYGNRLISAVGGTVLFRSIMIAVLPRLTRAYASDDREQAGRLTVTAMRLMLAVSLPLTAVGCVLAVPAAEAVFGVGRFSGEDAHLLGLVLVVLSLSLAPSAIQRALLAPFYAVRETRVPLRNTVYGVLANWALLPVTLPLLWGTGYEVLGIAAAYSAAQLVNVAHAWRRLRTGDLMSEFAGIDRLRVVASPLVAAATAAGVWTLTVALAGEGAGRGVVLGGVGAAGALGMAAGLLTCGSGPLRQLRRHRGAAR